MKRFSQFVVFLFVATVVSRVEAQAPRIPEASPVQTIIQDLGLGKITITYSRPNVKGRIIFGGINPYGEVWRTGANSATTIDFTENVKIEGNTVPAGSYSLFTIPGKEEWTIILNKTVKQWGAYSYKEADDFLRFKVKPVYLGEKRESFTIQFANVNAASNDLFLAWDHAGVNIHLQATDDDQIVANISELMKGDRKPYYFNAIQYYYENNKDLNTALRWALEAETAAPATWFNLWEARIRLKMGDKKGAFVAAQHGFDMAKAKDDQEYMRLNKAVIDQAKD